MKDPELDVLIKELETSRGMSVAEFDGVAHALAFLLPDLKMPDASHIGTADHAMLIADQAYPDWSILIRGLTNDRDGHWSCRLHEPDSENAVGIGRSPVLAQAILAAVIRLAMAQKE